MTMPLDPLKHSTFHFVISQAVQQHLFQAGAMSHENGVRASGQLQL